MDIDDFKSFLKTIPSIKDEVIKGRYTWQQIYEFYVLYGEKDKMWDPYREGNSFDLSSLLEVIKHIDLDALSSCFEGIQKILDIVSPFISKEHATPQDKSWYDE